MASEEERKLAETIYRKLNPSFGMDYDWIWVMLKGEIETALSAARADEVAKALGWMRESLDDGWPNCNGEPVNAGHGDDCVRYSGCDKPATWWHPGDQDQYCDEHCTERGRKWLWNFHWAAAIRARGEEGR